MRLIAANHKTILDAHAALVELYTEEAERLEEDFDVE